MISIKIKKKKTHSNKTQIHPESSSPTPFIDKLSVVLDPASDQDAYDIHSGIWPQINDTNVFKDAGKKAKWGKYKLAKRLMLQCLVDVKKAPLLQYAYHGKMADQLRLEFVPVDLGLEGVSQLHAVLTSVVESGWEYFISHGRVTRIDVSVDVPGVRMDEFLFLPPQAITSMHWKVNGHLKTIVHGKKQGDQTVIYDRKEKRLAKGQKWKGPSAIRVERRLVNLKDQKLSSLPLLPNPFAKMQMTVNMPGPPDEKKSDSWSMFEDSVKVRGLGAALALLPDERRTKYRKHLAAHPQPWWDPAAIWAKWPEMLKDLDIVALKA